MKIEFAPEVDQDNPYLRKVVMAIGKVLLDDDSMAAFVSTESTVSDFRPFGSKRSDLPDACDEIARELGVPVTFDSYLWELAAQMEASEKS